MKRPKKDWTSQEGAPSQDKPQKHVLIADDMPEVAALVAKRLRREDGLAVTPAHSVEEAMAAMKNQAFDVIMIDRGLPFSRGDYREPSLEDSKPFAQAIKRKGIMPEFLDGKILEENRNAAIILSTGIQGGLPDRLDGIDLIATKGARPPWDYIRMAVGFYEKTPEDMWEEQGRSTMTDLENYLHDKLIFSEDSPVAGQWFHVDSLKGFYWEMLQVIRDRANPENPHGAYLVAAEARYTPRQPNDEPAGPG